MKSLTRPALVRAWPAVLASRAQRSALPLGIATGLLLCGCSSSTLSSGAALASAGKVAATSMQQAALVSPADVQQLELSDDFVQAFNGGTAAAQVSERHVLVEAIQRELVARASVLDNLANAYVALGNLAIYDASGGFTSALSGLIASTNNYLLAAYMTPAPSALSNLLLPTAGGLLIGSVQAHQVREASNKILVQLDQVITAIKSYEPKYVQFKGIVASQSGDAAQLLYDAGLYSATPLLNAVDAPYGYTAVANADAKLASPEQKSARIALNTVQSTRLKTQAALVGAAYDQSVSTLNKLKMQHEALDQGVPIDLSQLLAEVGQVQAITNQMLASLNPKPTSGK